MAAYQQSDVLESFQQAKSLASVWPEHAWEPFAEDLSRTRSNLTEELSDMKFQPDAAATDGQIAGIAGVVAMHARGRRVTFGTAGHSLL